jgi:recombination protein RecT
MWRHEVDAIKKRSKASQYGPWVSDYPEMARKTVVRRLSKYLPMSVDLAKAFDHEDAQESGTLSAIDIEMGELPGHEEEAAAPATLGDKLMDSLTKIPG